MSSEIASQGSLFTSDFLTETIQQVSEWSKLGDTDLDQFATRIRAHFDSFPISQTPNESQAEDDLIWPILEALGWTESLRQQNLSPKGREDVPDGLLLESVKTKAKANSFPEEWKRYEFGRAVVESKRWARPLDRRSGRRGEGSLWRHISLVRALPCLHERARRRKPRRGDQVMTHRGESCL